MVVNVYLGGLGWYTINCFSKEKADNVAEKFCRQNKLNSIFKQVVANAIKKKKQQFTSSTFK